MNIAVVVCAQTKTIHLHFSSLLDNQPELHCSDYQTRPTITKALDREGGGGGGGGGITFPTLGYNTQESTIVSIL